MSPVDAALIRRKLAHIADLLTALKPLAQLSLDGYRQRLYERKAAERMMQEAIEAALDVDAHLIAELGARAPDDYVGGFVALGALGVLTEELARELAPSAGLHNRLVHEYDAIDDAKAHAAITTMLILYPRFVDGVDRYLRDQQL